MASSSKKCPVAPMSATSGLVVVVVSVVVGYLLFITFNLLFGLNCCEYDDNEFATCVISKLSSDTPSCQVRRSHTASLPLSLLCRVALSLCPSALCLHVMLLWQRFMVMPCVQQYVMGFPSALWPWQTWVCFLLLF